MALFPHGHPEKEKKTPHQNSIYFFNNKKNQFMSHMLIFRGIFEQKIAMMTFQRK